MKLLDLYCGVGLASWGYWLSGRFHEIVGVDIDSTVSSAYAFDFVQGDVMTLDYDFLDQFDFIHASPPCQAYSKATPRNRRADHPRLIHRTHVMLWATGKPYVVENVEGSGRTLQPTVRLSGVDVGLQSNRPRYFHISTWHNLNLSTGTHTHKLREAGGTYLRESHVANLRSCGAAHNRAVHGRHVTKSELVNLMGLEPVQPRSLSRMSIDDISQGIPPAMTYAIASAVIPHKAIIG